MILELKNLSIGYRFPLHKGVDLSLESGQLMALMGKNGSGKSTLIKTIAGIIPALSGDILVDKEKLSPQNLAKYISVVLTDQPIENLSVNEILKMGRLPYTGITNQLKEADLLLIERIAEQLQLSPLRNRIYGNLSDGEKQIVMIARAVIQETPIIILDEPLTHLDLENKARVLKLLKELAENGKLVVFSTHDLNLIIPEIDQFIVINDKINTPNNKDELKEIFNKLFSNDLLKFDEKEMRFKII